MANTEQLLAHSFRQHYEAILNDEFARPCCSGNLEFELLPAMMWIAFDAAIRAEQNTNTISPIYQEVVAKLKREDGEKYSSRMKLYQTVIQESDFRIEWMPQRDEDNYLFGGDEEFVVQVIWLLTDLLINPSCADHYFDFEAPSLMVGKDSDEQRALSCNFRGNLLALLEKELIAYDYAIYELLRKDKPEPIAAVFQKYYYQATKQTKNNTWYDSIPEELLPFMHAIGIYAFYDNKEHLEALSSEIRGQLRKMCLKNDYSGRLKFYFTHITRNDKAHKEWEECDGNKYETGNGMAEFCLRVISNSKLHDIMTPIEEGVLKGNLYRFQCFNLFNFLADLVFNPTCAENYENAPFLRNSMDKETWARKSSRFKCFVYIPLLEEMIEYADELKK